MENEIKEIMKSILKVDINNNSNRQNIDLWDSYSHLDILVNIENKYNIEFTPEEMGSINSYKNICEIVNKKNVKK